jgi:hypothetical protein
VHVRGTRGVRVGDVIRARITDSGDHDLAGTAVR